MSTPDSILNKLKLLLKLATSTNENEAANALLLADKLISKYGISQEEIDSLQDDKPLYGEDEKIFHTVGLVPWKGQLVLAIAKHFDCQIVQEQLVPSEGSHEYNYYAFGAPEDIANIKFTWDIFERKVEELISNNCNNRGPIYIESYCEGAVNSIKYNLEFDGILLPKLKSRIIKSEVKKDALVSQEKESNKKNNPVKDSIDVNSQSLVKDIVAYFTGMDDGKYISLQDLIDAGSDKLIGIQDNITADPID